MDHLDYPVLDGLTHLDQRSGPLGALLAFVAVIGLAVALGAGLAVRRIIY